MGEKREGEGASGGGKDGGEKGWGRVLQGRDRAVLKNHFKSP